MINPFHPDINSLGYSKTVDVPDDYGTFGKICKRRL